ncbi:glycerophosphodiester phosphodiesterase [Paenibacillus spongiae]|uniref:Glycerophosphodiester phosphodiesterase n=1 Tax=Paenibacillus spongiae TaxID=2909671 RepID=A0ABY5S9H7_9BACL|nr:glycerophosphodiester phosphodiesterase [Paenibacillus spongiae]UVI30215.1 glycerophosphodiester phosphodiesterase [Paenibacillus spongiae]
MTVDTQFPLITAHTGCEGMPDNSMQSVLAALQSGADVIEEDIRITGDGVLVCAHDDLIETPEGELSIAASSYLQLGGLVRLEDFVARLKEAGKKINLDLKVDECIEAVSAFVRQYDLGDQAFLSGCHSARALLVEQRAPELKRLLNADAELFRTSGYDEAVQTTIAQALAAGCFGININYRFVKPELIAAAAAAGLPVLVWTVQEAADMRRMIEWGVRSVTTCDVSKLVGIKAEWTA